jgi:hypothetical protein
MAAIEKFADARRFCLDFGPKSGCGVIKTFSSVGVDGLAHFPEGICRVFFLSVIVCVCWWSSRREGAGAGD